MEQEYKVLIKNQYGVKKHSQWKDNDKKETCKDKVRH